MSFSKVGYFVISEGLHTNMDESKRELSDEGCSSSWQLDAASSPSYLYYDMDETLWSNLPQHLIEKV